MNFKKLLAQSLIWRSLYFASMLLVNIFLSRFLKASGAGSLYYLTNIFSLIQLLLSLSLESGITFFASGKIIPYNKLLWLSVAWSFIIGLSIFIFTFLYLFYVKHSPAEMIMSYSFFVVCYTTGLLLTNYCSVLFYAQGNFFLSNFILILLNIAFTCTIPFSNNSSNASFTNIVLYRYFSVFFIQGVFLAIAFIIKNKSWQQFAIPSIKELTRLGRYSLIALAANVIFFLVYRVDYWFVHNSPVCTSSDLGNYIQVSKLGQLLLIVPQIIASVIFPKSASGADRLELNASVMTIARLLSQFFLFILVITAVFGKQIFILVFGETFDRMQLPFIIILPGIFCLSVLALLSAYFSGKGNLRVNVAGASVALIVVITGDYFFVPVYGIIAAATVSAVGYFVNLLYSLLQFYKDYSISWVDFFKWKRNDYYWLISLLTGK